MTLGLLGFKFSTENRKIVHDLINKQMFTSDKTWNRRENLRKFRTHSPDTLFGFWIRPLPDFFQLFFSYLRFLVSCVVLEINCNWARAHANPTGYWNYLGLLVFGFFAFCKEETSKELAVAVISVGLVEYRFVSLKPPSSAMKTLNILSSFKIISKCHIRCFFTHIIMPKEKITFK